MSEINSGEQIPSIWDGWAVQFRAPMTECVPGADCAMSFIGFNRSKAFTSSVKRVADYLRREYNLTGIIEVNRIPHLMNHDSNVIIYANNVLKLTPEQFREIDRLTQLEALAPLVDSALELGAVGVVNQ